MRRNIVLLIIIVSFVLSCDNSTSTNNGNDFGVKNLIKVPLARQGKNYTCGVASLQSILHYYGDEWRQDNLERELASDTTNGTNYRNIVSFSKNLAYNVTVYKDLSLDSLKFLVSKGFPMLLVIQAWADLPVDYKNEWESGHYVVCIGFDQQKMYFMDPSTLGNYTYIETNEFLDRWHDKDQEGNVLNNFAILIEKGNKKYNPENILKME